MLQKMLKYVKDHLRWVIIIAIVTVCVLSAGIATIVSYCNYKSYYDEMMKVWEEINKETPTETTEMTGITLSLADGVNYYDNGKAAPKKSDFIVEGKYTIGGREYSEEISAADWTLKVAADFARKGGEITATYVYEKDEKEKEFTASLDVSLEAVRLVSISVDSDPYIIYYKEGESFDKSGMSITAYNNDGSVDTKITLNDISVETGALTAGTDKALVYYLLDGEKIYGEVPITVVSEAEYNNGSLFEIVIIGDVEIKKGESLDNLDMEVRGKYESGNAILYSKDEYIVTPQTYTAGDTAQFGGKYRFMVAAKENARITAYSKVYVLTDEEAENAVVAGGADINVADNHVGNLANGDSITFKYTSADETYVDVYLNTSNGYIVLDNGKYYAYDFNLSNVLNFYINGETKKLGSIPLTAGGPYNTAAEAYAAYSKVYLGNFKFKKGENQLKVVFRNSVDGTVNYEDKAPIGYVDSMEVRSFDGTKVVNTVGEYLNACNEEHEELNFASEQIYYWSDFGFGTQSAWVYAICSDGTYFYFYVYTWSHGTSANEIGHDVARIVKFNPLNNQVMGYTELFNFRGENKAAFFWKNGYVYVMNSSNNFLRISTDKIESNGEYALEATNDIPLTGNNDIVAIHYNAVAQTYSVLYPAKVEVYNRVGTLINQFEISGTMSTPNYAGAAVNAGLARLTGDSNYLYIMYKANGVIAPAFRVYTYDGEYVGDVNLPNDTDIMQMAAPGSSNVQAVMELNGDIYFALAKWTWGNNTSIYKCSFPHEVGGSTRIPAEEETLGEYVENNNDKYVEDEYITEQETEWTNLGFTQGTVYIYAMCADDDYFYFYVWDAAASPANATTASQMNARIVKYNPLTEEVAGYSAPFQFSGINYASIFIKDGYVYASGRAGDPGANAVDFWRISIADLNGKGETECVKSNEDIAIKSSLSIANDSLTVYYEPSTERYAVMSTISGSQLSVFDKEGNLAVKFSISSSFTSGFLPDGGSAKVTRRRITADENYIYVVYTADKVISPVIRIYKWDGTYVGETVISNSARIMNFATTTSTNVQAIMQWKGNLYFAMVKWASGNQASVYKTSWYFVEAAPDFTISSDATGESEYTLENSSVVFRTENDMAVKLSVSVTGEYDLANLTFTLDGVAIPSSRITEENGVLTLGTYNLKAGYHKLEISVNGTAPEFELLIVEVVKNGEFVEPELEEIVITTNPAKTAYIAGETFDGTGMVITAKYSDNSQKVIGDYTVDKTEALTEEDVKVTVSYQGKTAELDITVAPVVEPEPDVTPDAE